MLKWEVLPGLNCYQQVITLMEQYVEQVILNQAPEKIMLLEHQDVYTAGTGYLPEELLGAGDIPVYYTGRGGKFTYHGPGQRVIYPILNLAGERRAKDIRKFIRDLEQWIIAVLKHYDLKAFTCPGRVGIWVKAGNAEQKIAAIGVRLRKWVSFHGIAINVTTDLTKFNNIIPCGLQDFGVISLEKLGIKTSMLELDNILKHEGNLLFDL